MEFFQRREIFRNINESYTHTYIYIYLILSRVVFEKKKKQLFSTLALKRKKTKSNSNMYIRFTKNVHSRPYIRVLLTKPCFYTMWSSKLPLLMKKKKRIEYFLWSCYAYQSFYNFSRLNLFFFNKNFVDRGFSIYTHTHTDTHEHVYTYTYIYTIILSEEHNLKESKRRWRSDDYIYFFFDPVEFSMEQRWERSFWIFWERSNTIVLMQI